MRVVTYLRVSTKRQGQSGLGLESQRGAVQQWAKSNNAKIVAEYIEVESGKRSDRPKLNQAIAHAKAVKGRLVIAKLDRLSRNVWFLSKLMKDGIDFVACDNPNANKMMIQLLVVFAENEIQMISDRTKAALKSYRRGRKVSKRVEALYHGNVPAEVVEATAGKLGAELPQCRNLTDEARRKGAAASAAANRTLREEAYVHLLPIVQELRATGLTLQAIADRLNADGFTTRRGKPWNAVQAMRLLG